MFATLPIIVLNRGNILLLNFKYALRSSMPSTASSSSVFSYFYMPHYAFSFTYIAKTLLT